MGDFQVRLSTASVSSTPAEDGLLAGTESGVMSCSPRGVLLATFSGEGDEARCLSSSPSSLSCSMPAEAAASPLGGVPVAEEDWCSYAVMSIDGIINVQ